MTSKTGKRRIIVVDDEEDIRLIFQRALTGAGHECRSAASGFEALELLSESDADVIVTDMRMPGMDGLEFTEKVKAQYHADVIVVTGFSEDMRYEGIIRKGASDFIRKPVPVDELLVRVDRVLRERDNLSARKEAEKKLTGSYSRLRCILDETVLALGAAMEKRDPYTSGHQNRVAALACAIAQEIGLSDTQIEGIRMAGLLHDIGKISIPSDILNKPSKLNIHEFNLIKLHPQTGCDIIAGIEFDQPIAQIVLQHHERLDGSGYPQGLTDTNILYEAKVIAVSDVVEAVHSHRPYRAALGQEKALEIILAERGTKFDAIIVDTCVTLLEKHIFSFDTVGNNAL